MLGPSDPGHLQGIARGEKGGEGMRGGSDLFRPVPLEASTFNLFGNFFFNVWFYPMLNFGLFGATLLKMSVCYTTRNFR